MWEDKPSDEMTLEEARAGVRDLRKAYRELFSANQYLKQQLCKAKNVKHFWEDGKEEWKTTFFWGDLMDIKQQIIDKAEEIAKALQQGHDVEVRKNPKGELAILKVKKQNI